VSDTSDFNRAIIDEFRANEGRVGGPFEGSPVLLLTSTGAKSGERRTTPVMYLPDGERMVVFASKGGAPDHPSWYKNLEANPDATIQVRRERIPVRARTAQGSERTRLWELMNEVWPAYDEYQRRTDREIPVVVLERR